MSQAEPMNDEELRKWAEAVLAEHMNICGADASTIHIRRWRAVLSLLDRQRWIPVTEKLPEGGLVVLGRYLGDRNYRETVFCYRNHEKQWVVDRAEPKWRNPTITHWRELPAPPEEVRRRKL